MIKKLLVLFLLSSTCTYAETIKTDVLVIGGTPSGMAAAIQCARSNVKTILISRRDWMEAAMQQGTLYIKAGANLPTGFWGEYNQKVKDFYTNTTGYDAPNGIALKFDLPTGMNILKQIADTVKKLTIKTNTQFTEIKKDGTSWDVTITENGITNIIEAKIVIDATEKGEVVIKAGATLPKPFDTESDGAINLTRTAIAVADLSETPKLKKNRDADYFQTFGYSIPMRDVVVRDADNLLITEKVLPFNDNVSFLPVALALGQGVGTVAAYVAFFKTTTKNLKVRTIQQELLDFKGYLVPFTDIKRDDKYIRAVQQIGATGMLKGGYHNDNLLFMPDAIVTTAEIKPVLTEIYSRAFIWFNKEKPAELFTQGNLLSLISEFTLTEPQTLRTTMQRDWKAKYNFNTDFDLNKPVTRLEFAVLVNQFLNPFARTVDLQGNIVN